MSLKASLAAALSGDYAAHPVGTHIAYFDEHYKKSAATLKAAAVDTMRSTSDITKASHQLRQSAEMLLRGSGRLNIMIFRAIGMDVPSRWYVWAWTLIEHGDYTRGHAALRLAAEAYPLHAPLATEAKKRDAYYPFAPLTSETVNTDSNAWARPVQFSAFEVPLTEPAVPRFGGREYLIVGTREPLLLDEECSSLVDAAETNAQRSGGWASSRHVAFATVDVPVRDLPSPTLRWFNQVLAQRIFPLAAEAYPELIGPLGGAAALRVHDAFVVKYEAKEQISSQQQHQPASQRELHRHTDQSLISFTIGLNDMDDYSGGGTYFDALRPEQDAHKGKVLGTRRGHATMFPGCLGHAGSPITSGYRYILVLFLYADGWNASGQDDTHAMSVDPLVYPWVQDIRDALPLE